jgi:DNA polymerase-3 subunit delta
MLERGAPDRATVRGVGEKLTAYVTSHGGTAVRREDVERATSPGMREDAFALANAVLAGDRRSALAALDLCRKRREDPIAVLGALSRVVSDLLAVAVMAEGGCGKAEIAQTLRMHEYKASLYLRAAADFGTARLNGALTRLLEADRPTKPGHSGYLPLERFICTLPVGAGFRRRPEAPS